MDKIWMECTRRLTREYMNEVENFLDFSFTHTKYVIPTLAMSAIMYSTRLEMRSKLIY